MKNILTLTLTFFAISNLAHTQELVTERISATNKYNSVEQKEQDKDEMLFKGLPFPQQQNASLGIGIDYFDSLGIQSRYAYRILDKGFIEDVNDSFYIEGGAGLTFYGTINSQTHVTGFNLIATARWDFQYNPEWTMFADLGFGFNPVSKVDNKDVPGGGFFPAIGVGTIYSVTDTMGIRFDLSYQFLGIGLLYRF